jgi:CBS-domain-containing membrane protein
MKKLTAIDIMTGPVECVYIKDTVEQVAQLFERAHISSAVVIGKNTLPAGVITKTDLSRYQAFHLHFPNAAPHPELETIERWLTPGIRAVAPDTPVNEIVQKSAVTASITFL